MKMNLKNKRLYLLDMDGTIYIDETLFDGTLEFLDSVKKNGGRYIFITNNSSKGTETYIEKMNRLGISASPEDFLTSTDATVHYLIKNNLKDKTFYVCGTESLRNHFKSLGFKLSENTDDVDVLLLGYDTELSYKKLEDCCKLLFRKDKEVIYIATHPDYVCPTEYGCAPDCGSVIEMLKTATGKTPYVVGKPKPDMALLALEKFGYKKEEACIIGDRLYTDIACGVNAGIDSIFVLSGEGTKDDIDKYHIHPTYIVDGIKDVLKNMK